MSYSPPMLLHSQEQANRACERVGWRTIHPNKATKEATMSTTTKLTLSCGHVKPVEGDEIPAAGDKVHCAKCPGTSSGEMATRTVKTVGAPGTPLASHEADAATDVARNGEHEAEHVEMAKIEADEAGGDLVPFASKADRLQAAKQAGTEAKAAGGNAGEASARVLSMPIKQAPVQDRSSTAKRPRTGRLAFLNLSPVRNAAIQAALGRGSKVGKDGEDIAKRDLLVAVTNEAGTVDLHAAGVRVLLRNLPRAAADEKLDGKVRNAADRLNGWLSKHAEAAGYAD